MFRSAQTNPYDDIVAKTTDENLTSENWELVLNLCDKVNDEGEQGARNVISALLKRLTHRNANVQLYALSLSDSLCKNCRLPVHREMASKAFTQGLEKIITDRTTHDKVKQRALTLIATWTEEFQKDPSLGLMEECYNNLRSKNYKFEAPKEAPPPDVDDAVRRREEEELQRVLEMSVRDKGGRSQWSEYPSAPGGSSSAAGAPRTQAAVGPSQQSARYSPPPPSSGYVPASTQPAAAYPQTQTPAPSTANYMPMMPAPTPAPSMDPSTFSSNQAAEGHIPVVTRVRALHSFEPTEAGELAFEKGDVIKVVDRGYKDWWRGQLKGRTGIFPVNYVEPLPEPTATQLAKEAEQEASVFSQAANVDKLLTLLRDFDGSQDNLADNEDIQELYRTCMGLRPKIVKLIDKYSQKRADLVSMNESFVKARSIYERMMEQSLARVSEGPNAGFPAYGQPGPPGPQSYGWPGAQAAGYSGYPTSPHAGPQPSGQPNYPQQYAQHPSGPYGAPGTPGPYARPYGPGTPGPQPASTPAPYAQGGPAPTLYPQQVQLGAQPAPIQGPQGHPYPQQTPYAQQQQPNTQAYPQQQVQPQPQPDVQVQPQVQAQPSAAPQAGPPYVYDPAGTYPDENATAWARYYAQGGTDATGAAYFIAVPGVKEPPPLPETTSAPTQLTPQRQDSAGTVAPSPGPGAFSAHDSYSLQGVAQQQPPIRHDSAATVGGGHHTSTTIAGAPMAPMHPQDQGLQDQPSLAEPNTHLAQSSPGPYGGAPTGSAVYPDARQSMVAGASVPPQWGAAPDPMYHGLSGAMGGMSLGSPQEPPAQPTA